MTKNNNNSTDKFLHFKAIIAGIIFCAAYAPTFVWMWDRWFVRDSYYSHGILIPFVTFFLIWQRRKQLQSLVPSCSLWGVVLIVVGLIIYWFSSLLRIYFTSGFSMLIVLYGLVLYFYGKAIFRKILFPLFFLIFMVPLPLVAITNISFRLKLLAAEIATVLLNNMGLLAVREGSIIKMQSAYVIVDDVCSGLRSLISLTALGSIFAYWLNSGMLKKILLFLSTIPIAIVTNVIRVILLSIISEVWGPQYAEGFVHDATGFLVFALAFIFLYAVKQVVE